MTNERRRYSADFKSKIALEAVKGAKTVNELASLHGLHPTQIALWKKQLLAEAPAIFSDKRVKSDREKEGLEERLYQQIGQLKVELDWLKKNLDCSVEQRRQLVEHSRASPSVPRQCELLGIHRSGLYYKPRPASPQALLLMRLIDEQYTRAPFYGSRRMAAQLTAQGQPASRKRVIRLMRLMGLAAIYPRPRLSQPGLGSKIYPYLLRGVKVERIDQVWSADITYIRLPQGFIYLTAVIDWFSRCVLSWEVSTSHVAGFCVSALDAALSQGTPEVFNTDQGSQFTSAEFTGRLLDAKVAISMDGRGRALDNIFVERLWRTIKYEEVYLKEYAGVPEAVRSLAAYLLFYNKERLHQSLGYRPPLEVYRSRRS